jgi:hypothetical protein
MILRPAEGADESADAYTLKVGGVETMVEIVNVERHLTPYIAFRELAGREDVGVIDTLTTLSFRTTKVVRALGKFLEEA